MASKLRPLYDGLYTGIDTWLLAIHTRRSSRRYSRTVPKNPEVEEKYRTVIRPYWKQFRVRVPKKYWFRLFATEHTGFSEKYIPDDLWLHRIIPHYNNLLFSQALQDKCLLDEKFPEIKHPVTPVRNINGIFYGPGMRLLAEREAAESCLHRGRILVKPSVGSGEGHGIQFYDSDTLTADEMCKIFAHYGKNFLVQEKLRQHPVMAELSGGAVNTCRITTFLFHGEVRVLSMILRCGSGKSELDNIAQGGCQYRILPDGHLDPVGFTYRDGTWSFLDNNPKADQVAAAVIPSLDRAVETVKELAAKNGHFPIIGWDIAIDESGEPVMIEYNVIPGEAQETNGPTFGDLTDEVLTEVFGRRK